MQSLLFFILALAILVVVHEFGHFWVARRCGVKVLKFSVGFGKALWTKQGKDGTEYVLSAIPLGGFVKMLDEREGDVDPAELDQTFNRKPLSARVAIVAAGPIANLIFAVIAYWFIFAVIGIPGTRAIISDVTPYSHAAQAQLISGDVIIEVDSQATPTWFAVNKMLSDKAENGGLAILKIESNGVEVARTLNIPKWTFDPDSPVSLVQTLGMEPVNIPYRPLIGVIIEGGAAEQAGLQIGDELISADNEMIDNWPDWVTLIRASADKTLSVTVKRGEQNITLTITPRKSEANVGQIGASVDDSKTLVPDGLRAKYHYPIVEAAELSVLKTWQFSTSTLKSLGGMLMGTVSMNNIGGPISIAQFAGASAERGLLYFVNFLAMISISLGILNLLPIPVLDGGHLALYLIEWLRGSPLSEYAQQQGQKLGIILLLMLMSLAFFNDLSRLFG